MRKRNKIIILAIIACIAIAGAFFHFHSKNIVAEKQNSQTSSSTKQDNACTQESKDDCFKIIGAYDGNRLVDALIDRINSQKNINSVPDIGAETLALKQMACSLSEEKDEGLYNRAKDFLSSSHLENEVKQEYEISIDNIYSGVYDEPMLDFNSFLADGDLNDSHQLQRMCIIAVHAYAGNSEIPSLEEFCNNLHDKLIFYTQNKDKFYADYINNEKVDPIFYNPSLMIAYRLGGINEASDICNRNTDIQKKEQCILNVSFLDVNCGNISKNISDSICNAGN